MRVPPLMILASLSASLLGACASTGGVFSSDEVAQCEKALGVLIRTGPNKAKFRVDCRRGSATDDRRPEGSRT